MIESVRPWLLTGLVALIAGCGADRPGGTEDDYVHRVSAQPASASDGYEIERRFPGLISPRQMTALGLEFGGRLDHIAVDEGDRVESGQVLARLDTRLLTDERDRLDAQREDLAARLALARRNLQRAESLRADGFTSERDLDELATAVTTLESQSREVTAALAANQSRLDKAVLIAPFGGTVSKRLEDEGAVVGAGAPIFMLLEASGYEARVGVPVRLLPQLTVGDGVQLEVHGRPSHGVVIAIGTDVTRSTLTVPVRIALDPAVRAVAGDQAALVAQEREQVPGFWLPATAITDGLRGLWNVYALVAGEQDDRYIVEARDVHVAWSDQERIYVTGALADEELVMTGGLHRVVPGQHVRLRIDERIASQ